MFRRCSGKAQRNSAATPASADLRRHRRRHQPARVTHLPESPWSTTHPPTYPRSRSSVGSSLAASSANTSEPPKDQFRTSGRVPDPTSRGMSSPARCSRARDSTTSRRPGSGKRQRQGPVFAWRIIKQWQPKQPTNFPRSWCSLALLCSGGLVGRPAELLGGALAGFFSRLELRLHFLKIATAPGEVLFDGAEGFTVLLQASLQPLLCLRSLIQSVLRTVE